MKLSPLGLAILAFAEDFRATAYRDSGGVWTYGYGHTGPEVHEGAIVAPDQALTDLAADIHWAEAAVERRVTLALNQRQFDALVMFVYNIGETRFAESALVHYLNASDAKDAAIQFMVWDKIRGVENVGLERRRAIEKALFLSEG